MNIDLSAARGFSIALADLPGDGTDIRQYPPDKHIGADGPLLEVRLDDGTTWLGRFADERYGSPPAVTERLFAMPGGTTFCVVTGGAGYIVDAFKPSEWVEVEGFPITSVRSAAGVVLFGDFTDLAAYEGCKKIWSSGRLVLDGLKIDLIRDGVIHVSGDECGSPMHATVDIKTGSATGAWSDR